SRPMWRSSSSRLSLHDALPISLVRGHGMVGVATATVFSNALTCAFYFLTRDRHLTRVRFGSFAAAGGLAALAWVLSLAVGVSARSEEHTSELQSRENLVCRLLL